MKDIEIKNQGYLSILLNSFKGCDDYRDIDRVTYTLSEILFLTFCGSVGGCESYQDIVDFGESKLSWLRKYLAYENGIPSHDTIGKVMGMINPKQLEKVLMQVCELDIKLSNGMVLNVDGKRIRGSATRSEQQLKISEGGKQSVNMVNIYCDELNSCLSSVRVGSKESEPDSVLSILDFLDMSGCLLTFDAGYCYKKVTDKVIGAQADYLIQVKKNQGVLYETAEDLLSRCPEVESDYGVKENGHGREERRVCKILNFSNLERDFLENHESVFEKWKGLKSLIKVESTRRLSTENKTTNFSRYYISSKEFMPKKANGTIRGHWLIENKLHWILDAAMGEDQSKKRAGNSAQNFSIFRKLAFNKLKAYDDPKVSMKRRMRRCLMNEEYLEKVLQIS